MPDEPSLQLFLRGQQLFQLKDKLTVAVRKQHVCGSAFDEKAWFAVPRADLEVKINGDKPPWRVGLMCDAGLGKTTNMEWLQAHLCGASLHGSAGTGLWRGRQLPLLLRLDRAEDLQLLQEERKLGQPSQALVQRLAKLIEDRAGGDPRRHQVAHPTNAGCRPNHLAD